MAKLRFCFVVSLRERRNRAFGDAWVRRLKVGKNRSERLGDASQELCVALDVGVLSSRDGELLSRKRDDLACQFQIHFKFSVGSVATHTGTHPAALVKPAGGVMTWLAA
ncbi:hypothetical protein [Caulobacter segnis]|uniref:Uncharacterized protein n=1 Tax=Caulobacter segnis TaxID=88688 RepID=A0A2W5V8X7_9CAUL|nr:hypothetical protein [Caulobacter segnis]PZR36469.1 MAG: hypothetical protein DI526_03255 [Caulobacter segnis]